MNTSKFILGLIFVSNVYNFILMGVDKRKAIKRQWRIKESTLLLSALCFGALGSFLGMLAFRHKIRHLKFTILVPTFLVLQVYILVTYFKF